MGFVINCIKYLVFIFNFLFAITGLLTLIVGALIWSKNQYYEHFVGESFLIASIVLMIVGSLVFFISFLGCCGAIRESSCLILTFSFFLLLVFIAEIGVGVAGFIKHAELPGILEKRFNETLDEYTTSIEAMEAWSFVQSELKCCGIYGPDDWKPLYKNKTRPSTCCHEFPVNVKDCEEKYAEKHGCYPKLLKFLDTNSFLLGFVGIIIAIIQLFGVVFACTLFRAFRENYETV